MIKQREITYIRVLQFLGPIFVILGHSLNGLSSYGFWWIFTKQWIYIFHMPLFFMISGYLLSYNGWLNGKSYAAFVKGKFLRLIVPYLLWNATCLVPKYILQYYIGDDVQISFFYLLKAFTFPRQNILGHTWFLVALFLVYLLTPIWQQILRSSKLTRFAVIVVGVLLYTLPFQSEFFCISDLHKDLLFFYIGCMLGQIPEARIIQKINKYFYVILLSAVITSVISVMFYNVLYKLQFLPCVFILMSLLAIAIKFQPKTSITMVAQRSFGIYIMHWPIMILTRIMLQQILNFNMGITVFAMIALGWIVPNVVLLALKKIHQEYIRLPLKYLMGV